MEKLHQLSDAVTPGDAISDQIFLIRRWLREMGYASEIYAEHIAPELAGQVRPAARYRPAASESLVIYHHSIGSDVAERLLALGKRQIMIYHNITPPDFYLGSDPALAQKLARGREQLAALRGCTVLGLGDSPYNEQELIEFGYAPTGVLPITFDPSQYDLPPNPALLARFEGQGPILLFVGRLVPNKRQEDLIKLLYFYRRIRPTARLVLVGSGWSAGYEGWLKDLGWDLGLLDHVVMAGHVTHQDLLTYFRLADVYVSMSEHEGFGKPLIESMYLGLPVLAYAAASVPGTMGDAGILFHEKKLEALAELVDLLVYDERLRQRVIGRQKERVRAFLEPCVRQVWLGHLERVLRRLPEKALRY